MKKVPYLLLMGYSLAQDRALFYCSMKTYVVGTYYKHLIDALLMSSHNIFSCIYTFVIFQEKDLHDNITKQELWLYHQICGSLQVDQQFLQTYIALDKGLFPARKYWYFSYFSTNTYAVCEYS